MSSTPITEPFAFSRKLSICLWLAWIVILMRPSPIQSQVFELQGGSSSLYQAHGGSLEIHGTNYEGRIGAGYLQGLRLGASLRTSVRGYTLSLGDDLIPFRLSTDVFNSSHYFWGRGLGVTAARERTNFFAFAGTTSSSFASPFFRGARAEKGVGLFFLETKLKPSLLAFSRNLVSDRQTSINGLEWQPREDLRMALAGGVGANQGYFASSFTAERPWVSLKAGYVRAGSQFRRVTVETPLSPENDRENILVTLRPRPSIAFTATRMSFSQPFNEGSAGTRGTVNQFLANVKVARFRVGGGLFQSRVRGFRSTGTYLGLGRNIADRLQVDANLFRSGPQGGPTSTVLSTTVREVISPRLSLLQVVTHSNGHTSVSFGGNFLSNRFTVGLEYKTLFVPFRTGSQFRQALVMNLRLKLFGNFQVNAGSYVAPNGSTKYTVGAGTFLYRQRGIFGRHAPAAISIHKNIVRGRVIDEKGKPIQGAALRIDGDVVWTDSQGKFFVRKRKAGSYRLQVLAEQFLTPGHFEPVSAPDTVTASPEDTAAEVTIILRRSRPPVP